MLKPEGLYQTLEQTTAGRGSDHFDEAASRALSKSSEP
jgi:hypothetical protein